MKTSASRPIKSRPTIKARHPYGAPPTCHPDRKHQSNGLCRSCYTVARRRGEVGPRTPAACHPDRPAYAKGQCAPCYETEKLVARQANWDEARWARFRAQANRRAARYEFRQFGITEEDYDRMLAEQDGLCAICRQPEPEGRRLHVDHDHDTDEVCGLLCGPCNRGIGMLGEDPVVIEAALAYVRARKGAA